MPYGPLITRQFGPNPKGAKLAIQEMDDNLLYLSESIDTVSGSFETFTQTYNTGSFTGSFVGDGTNITGVTAEWDGTHVGNAEITGSLIVTGGVTGSFTGSFIGDGSGLTGVSDTNFANTNLTFTGTRTHDLSGNSLFLLNGSSITLSGSGGFNEIQLKHDTNTFSLQSIRTSFNPGNADIDFRVGSVGTDYAINVDGGTDRVSINKNSPNSTLDVNGDTIITGSLAQGKDIQATGDFSHAEGELTTATGDYSHAEGSSTIAIGDYSHAEGDGASTGVTTAYSSSVSSGVITLDSVYSDVSGEFTQDGTLFLYDTPFDGNYETTSFPISQSSFDGTNTIVELYDTSVDTTTAYVGDLTYGIDSWTGNQTIPGNYSHAEGGYTFSIGDYSHAEGESTVAGYGSHAEGSGTKAIGNTSHAEGSSTLAFGEGSHAEGDNTLASGSYSHAEGSVTTALGNFSHAEGIGTIASGGGSHAEGKDTQAIGLASHAEGRDAIALGDYSHAEGGREGGGTRTTSIGLGSHAEGASTTASGDFSHSEGGGTTAQGNYSHAEGKGTTAQGNYSHAEGSGTIASGSYQHVQGQFNISSSAQSAFIIGNGTADGSRSNLVFASGSQFEVTGSLNVTGGITGSYTGSFTGDGAGLYNIPASGITGLNLSQIASGSATASIAPNTGFRVNTDSEFTGSMTISGSASPALSVIGSGSAVFTVNGSVGEIFSVTDSLSGSLFAVNNSSGFAILDVNSDNTIQYGDPDTRAVTTTVKNTVAAAGVFTVYSLPTASYDGAWFEYVAKSGSDARAGQIMSLWSGTAVNFTETTTTDFGDTSGLSFTVAVSGSNFALTGSVATAGWTIKTIVRSI